LFNKYVAFPTNPKPINNIFILYFL
jgi:hypothetical protein